jgi:conserved oligomeric Golgi complex subunit 8
MADPIFEILLPYFEAQNAVAPHPADPTTTLYLNRLTTLSLSSLTKTEPQALLQTHQSLIRSLQDLSKRSYKPIIQSSDHLSSVRHTLPRVGLITAELNDGLPKLESEAARFADKYSRSAENPILDRRRKAMLLSRNVDRVSDILDLPGLLSSAIATATTSVQASGTGPASTSSSYASALDLHAHIKRLQALYPQLDLVKSIGVQAEEEMKSMTTNLISSLQSQGIKLAAAMRTIGWLRRVAPELDTSWTASGRNSLGVNEGALGAIFLVCRLKNLLDMLEALEPLRELADQETSRRLSSSNIQDRSKPSDSEKWSGGQQTERYLKRYIEIFREQSFAMISMYKSIFPSALPAPGSSPIEQEALSANLQAPKLKSLRGQNQLPSQSQPNDLLQPIPSALATFPAHLLSLLSDTLKEYLPNIKDRASRDSLLTQILYCAGSLGRLGGDFSLMLALLGEDVESEESAEDSDEEPEWVEIMKKHRIQASRLELLASGVGVSRPTKDTPSG